jgi:hypothetical protein
VKRLSVARKETFKDIL